MRNSGTPFLFYPELSRYLFFILYIFLLKVFALSFNRHLFAALFFGRNGRGDAC